MIKIVAKTLTDTLKGTDSGRVSVEEFAVILRHATAGGAGGWRKWIRKSIATAN